MKLNHIALNIQSKEELVNFYQNILGFDFEYQFNLDSDYATRIFGIAKQPEVYHYKKEDLHLELFVHPESIVKDFAHVCIEVTDRETIAGKCELAGYPVTRIVRDDKPDLLFIRDRTGNTFELKIKSHNIL